MAEIAKNYKEVKLAWVNSDECNEIVDKFDIEQVPSLAVIHPDKANADIVVNPSPETLMSTVEA